MITIYWHCLEPTASYEDEKFVAGALDQLAQHLKEEPTTCYAIWGWKVLGEGKLSELPTCEVEEILQVYPADFEIPPLGKKDMEHLRRT